MKERKARTLYVLEFYSTAMKRWCKDVSTFDPEQAKRAVSNLKAYYGMKSRVTTFREVLPLPRKRKAAK